MRKRIAWLLLLFFTAACGARSDLASSAATSSSSSGASLRASAIAASSPEGVPIGAPFPIAPGLEATAPILAATPAGEVIAFMGFAPSQPQQAYVTLLSCPP